MKKIVGVLLLIFLININAEKVLMVVTNHSELGDTNIKTGYYLPEVTHPYFKFIEAGLEVDFASPRGGYAPMDPKSKDLKDPMNKKFFNNPKLMALLKETKKLSEVEPSKYKAIIYAGGHGTMWDFKDSVAVKSMTKKIYEQGGVVAAVCHGPAALVDVKLSNGNFLLKGKKVTGFTNKEEEIVKLTKTMPFLLESSMRQRGADFIAAKPWAEKVVVDQRIVTGQNPASAGKLGQEVVKLILKK